MTSTDVRIQLLRLAAERLDAADLGLADNPAYMLALDDEISECRAAYVGLAVTEIASFRAQLSGPQMG